MIKVRKIIYIYENKKNSEKPEYLTFASKKELETYRLYLIRNKHAQNIYFEYEEH